MQYTDAELDRRIVRLFDRKSDAIQLMLDRGYLDFAMELYASLIDQVAHLYIQKAKVAGKEYKQAAQEMFVMNKDRSEVMWSIRNGLLHAGSSQADMESSRKGAVTFITSTHGASENMMRLSSQRVNHPPWVWNIEALPMTVLETKERFIQKIASSSDIKEHFRRRAERLIRVKSNSEWDPDDMFERSPLPWPNFAPPFT